MALFAKAAAHTIPSSEVSFVRAAFGLVACGLVALRRPFVAHNKLGLFWRGLTGALAVSCYFLGIEHLPVGIATMLNYTSPVFTALWSGLFFAQRLGSLTVFALFLTTSGIGFVLHGQAPPGSLGLGIYELAGLCGAMLSGVSMALIAEVRRTDGSWEIFAAFSLGCFLVSAPLALAHPVMPSFRTALFLIGMGSCSVAAQLLMTYTMRFVPATLAGVVSQLTPVTSLVVGWVLFEERFGTMTAFGIALTLCGAILGAYLASRPRA